MPRSLRVTLPAWCFAQVLLQRGTVVWVGVRLVMWAVVALPAIAARGKLALAWPAGTPPGALAVSLVVGFLAFLDARRRGEVLLLQNMGVRPATVALLGWAPGLALEVALAVLRGASGMP